MAEIVDSSGPLEEALLVEAEGRFGAVFPSDYREFLLTYNGGRPVPDVFDDVDGEEVSCVAVFLGIDPRHKDDIIAKRIVYLNRIPDDLVPIGRDPCGNAICLGIGSERYGQVYFWDHECEAEEDGSAYYENVLCVAETFTDFLENLHPLRDEV